ncbi:MAG: hypothetical protein M3209_18995 [Acidobacteriota bacterium]|nr:hypothetical protein [Acidobacteriota bacterium]
MAVDKPYSSEFSKIEAFKSKYWILVFLAYVVLLAAVVSNHEPWMDEAQPWLYGQDLSVRDLLVKYLRYDGHPPLWYVIVMIPAKLGFPYFTINVLSACFSALGVWLFLRYSPFPATVKILFPFSFFVFYQYGVVARSYCLIPPLLFLIAIVYKKKMEHPILYSLLLCLLANVSAYTFLMAGAFLFVHLLDIVKQWKQLDKQNKVSQALAVLMLGLTAFLVVLILAPPPDQSFAQGYNLSLMNFLDVSQRRIAGALVMDELGDNILAQTIISLAIFVVTFLWFCYKRLTLLFLLPSLLILTLFAVKYSNVWHEGILFFLWIFVLWISFERDSKKEPAVLSKTVLVLMTVVLAVQVYWSVFVIRYDLNHNYSAGYEVAQYIKENQLEDKRLFLSGWKSLAILPYFEKNIFYNHNNGSKERFWFLSTRNPATYGAGPEVINRIENEQPDLAVFASDHMEPNTTIEIKGYRFVGAFEGNLCWKTGLFEPDTFWVFRKIE